MLHVVGVGVRVKIECTKNRVYQKSSVPMYPCGLCIGCKHMRAVQMHAVQMHAVQVHGMRVVM